jgi:hypothetical protein
MTESNVRHPTPARAPRPVRAGFLLVALIVVVAAWLLKEPIRQWITTRVVLANDAPRLETLEDLFTDARDPAHMVLAAWATGKIVHRQAAIRRLATPEAFPSPLPTPLETILLVGALDPDLNVRETALSGLRNRGHSALGSLAAAQLEDVDPELRLLGLRHLYRPWTVGWSGSRITAAEWCFSTSGRPGALPV